MSELLHVAMAELEAGLDSIRGSPTDEGPLELIVRRPRTGEREVLDCGQLDLVEGLVGDKWRIDSSSSTPDGTADPEAQLTIMNSRLIAVAAGAKDCWPLAGDQLYVDLDLSLANLPPGTRLAIGDALVELTSKPHTGCGSFMKRFGRDATKFVNSRIGRELRLRGVNAKVIKPGAIRLGDIARKLGRNNGETCRRA
jgi:hypothetical protein